jgi:hypothetical protein
VKAKLIGWIDEASGSYGDTVFREKQGKTIIARKPKKRVKPFSEAQLTVQKRFRAARDYANYVKLNPDLLTRYEEAAREAGTSVYMLCRRDWYRPPEIDEIKLQKYSGQIGQVIRFTVHDEIGAETVAVTLSDADLGDLIEKGEAVEEYPGSGHWMYTATQQVAAGRQVRVLIEATDYPGNTGAESDTKLL